MKRKKAVWRGFAIAGRGKDRGVFAEQSTVFKNGPALYEQRDWAESQVGRGGRVILVELREVDEWSEDE